MLAVTATPMGLINTVAVLRDGEGPLVRAAGVAIAAIVARYRGEGPVVAFAGNARYFLELAAQLRLTPAAQAFPLERVRRHHDDLTQPCAL